MCYGTDPYQVWFSTWEHPAIQSRHVQRWIFACLVMKEGLCLIDPIKGFWSRWCILLNWDIDATKFGHCQLNMCPSGGRRWWVNGEACSHMMKEILTGSWGCLQLVPDRRSVHWSVQQPFPKTGRVSSSWQLLDSERCDARSLPVSILVVEPICSSNHWWLLMGFAWRSRRDMSSGSKNGLEYVGCATLWIFKMHLAISPSAARFGEG